ncbi:NAC transcription factor 32-like [Dendrobium catenatum]|nr:NAC transcription factor 32-like [Dendrobium catenatum]
MELPATGFGLDREKCSSAFTPPLFDADDGSIDEKVMLFLSGRKAGDPTPANVITNVNPFSLEPWDFPEGMWYLYNYNNYQSCTEWRNIKVKRIGYWKPMDEITIFQDAATVGGKITLEFYVGLEPFGNRTGWKMQEYHRDQKSYPESNFSQDYQLMCRVFLQNEKTSKICDFKLPNEEQLNPSSSCDDDDVLHVESLLMRFVEDEESSLSTDAQNRSQPFTGSDEIVQAAADSNEVAALEDQNSFSSSDSHAYFGFPMDDYLELNDLCDPGSASSSSNNSSNISFHSNEYFNSEELLRCLGSASSQNMQEEHKDYNCCVSTSAKPVNVVINPSQPSDSVYSQGNTPKHCVRSHAKRTHSRSSDGSSNGPGSKSLHRIVKYCCLRTL